jgi:DMSO/TMAO reductase YedYZ molybdopterin-dependent catalytic subunit
MTLRNVGWGALVGALLTAPLIALAYLANQLLDLAFIPFDFFDWLTRVLPGPLVTFGIDLMIDTFIALNIDVADTAKTAEQITAVLQFWLVGATAGAIFFAILGWRRSMADTGTGVVMGALFGLPLVAISLMISLSPVHPVLRALWLLILFAGWGIALAFAYRRLQLSERAPAVIVDGEARRLAMPLNRRQFLIRLGAAAATVTVIGSGVGAVLATAARRRDEATLAMMEHEGDETAGRVFPNAGDPVTPAPGTRPEYTPVKDHYKVFIRAEPTVIPAEGYALPIVGMVDNMLMLTLDDIRQKYESFDQYVTLSCISGRIGTSLISTTLWSGVSMQDIIASAGVQQGAQYLHIRSGDGFYETVSLELINSDRRIMLCHSWDGRPLPVDHGFPLRIWIPDRYGMKQPKWITAMEITDEYIPGYWVERRWDEVARVNTTSVIDTVAVDAIIENDNERLVPIGGIAYAGARGISKVEVRVNNGAWQEAQLRAPLSETTWVIWRYDWPFAAGDHTFEVRCVDGDGAPQIEARRDARPSGSTGIHSVEASL